MFDPELYRSKAEVEQWKQHCPIASFIARMRSAGELDDRGLAALEADVAQEIGRAVAFAEAGTLEPVEDLERDVYTRAARSRRDRGARRTCDPVTIVYYTRTGNTRRVAQEIARAPLLPICCPSKTHAAPRRSGFLGYLARGLEVDDAQMPNHRSAMLATLAGYRTVVDRHAGLGQQRLLLR